MMEHLPLPGHIIELIDAGARTQPRTLQKQIGPSEVGTPCRRQLAYKLLQAPKGATAFNDPLPSMIGTGAHAEMERCARARNAELGYNRYLIEKKVTVRPGLTGSCDLFDIIGGVVYDWKFLSTSRLLKYRSGPSPVYRTQAHLYGLGFANEGFQVNAVSILLIPRGGQRKDGYQLTEPWDRQIALDALDRIDRTLLQLHDLDAGQHPQRIREGHGDIPAIDFDASDCGFCPFKAFGEPGPWQCEGSGKKISTPNQGVVTQGAFAL